MTTATTDNTEGRYKRCDICGIRYTSEELTKNWKGQQVCKYDFEPRHPSELFIARKPRITTPQGRGEGEYVIDALKSELKFTAVNTVNAGDPRLSIKVGNTVYKLVSGDILEYDYFIEQAPAQATAGGVDILYGDTTRASSAANIDENGAAIHTGTTTLGKWVHRKIAFVTADIGKSTDAWELRMEGNLVGTYIVHYKNLLIRDAVGNLVATGWVSGDPPFTTVQLQTQYAGTNTVTATTSFM